MLAHGRRDLVQSDTEQGTKAEMKILEEGEEKDEADLVNLDATLKQSIPIPNYQSVERPTSSFAQMERFLKGPNLDVLILMLVMDDDVGYMTAMLRVPDPNSFPYSHSLLDRPNVSNGHLGPPREENENGRERDERKRMEQEGNEDASKG
ncbi:hypothetical protein BJ165DRAFT_1599180 [Panaeolus papilionaceus]|nr:hypothetical protein BJ165DRAFT_1599180 [Panaeolus papilionaceus]